ncbi:hypothetical protein AB4Z18_02315 [Leifsonia sp. 2TAF2]|uniref:DUF6792 domain-containing protein n=1 Tax=Leifsonia sp. 2TAF2 TaxID=3233009 RepID=UPI003F962B64
MTTAEDYESVANEVYRVDPLKQNPPLEVWDKFYTDHDRTKQQWEVVEVSPNAGNGFQAFAVAPVRNNVVDLSHIEIAYAGTNFTDGHDVAADVGVFLATQSAQLEAAMKFAEKVERKHPGSTFSTVGHSLGGFLAMCVAAEKRWSSTAFNAPDAYRVMTPKTKEWVDEQNAADTNPLTDYVNQYDTVGNSFVNRSGAAVFVADDPNRTLLDYHNIGKDDKGKPNAFRFGADGEMVGAGVKQVDYGVILYNLDQTSVAEIMWNSQKGSPYPKVLVAMEPARTLAKTIASLAEKLREIKAKNTGLTGKMQSALEEAKREYPANHPYVSHVDVETCVAMHALEVHQNIDHDAVASVNTLVDKHITLVNALHDGIQNAIVNTLAHDVQAAAAFTKQPGK